MRSRNVRGARASLIALAIFIPVLYLIFGLTSILQDYRLTLKNAEAEARSTSIALSEHANRAIGEGDRFLLSAMAEVEHSGLAPIAPNGPAFHAILQKYTNELPQLQTINVIDNTGQTIATGLPGEAVANVRDRDYFQYQSKLVRTVNSGLFISHPLVSRVSGRWVFTISRRIANPDGTLKMLLVAGMDVDYFETFYQALSANRDAHLLLAYKDGTVLAESPHAVSRQEARSILYMPLFAHFHIQPGGSFQEEDTADHVARVVGYSSSRNYSLVSAVSISKPEILAPWRERAIQSAAIGIFTVGLLLSLLLVLWRQLNKLLAGQVVLQEKNESLAMAAQVFETSLHAILILSANGNILSANKAFTQLSGYPAEETIGRNISTFESSFIEADINATIKKSLLESGSWQGETRFRTKAGSELTLKQSVSMLCDAAGAIQSIVAIFQDISEQKLSEHKLHQLAHFDVLTNLPNRRTFTERIQHEIDLAIRRQTKLAVVFIDIDHFKTINDSLGHATGDLVLQEVAARLRGCLRAGDTVARIGGDEFVVLLEGNRKIDTFDRVAVKLNEALSLVMEISGREMYVAASMGISIFPQDGSDSETLLRNADTAMYRAKSAGRSCWRFFDESMALHATRRLELETALRRAVERNELVLYYQPQRSLHSERIVGVEALVRWERPALGVILPMEFIPLSEESGLIIAIGEWVLFTACNQAASWWREHDLELRIAVNIAAKQIHHKGFVDLVRDTLEKTGLPAAFLELEITESSIIDNVEETVSKLHQLKALGVTVAIDDFGTGYSSLSYLKQLPVDRLKIDRSFVKDTPSDSDDCAIVRTIISMSHHLGLSVIAEGLETREQLEFLREQHCDEIQGYLLSVPLPAEQCHVLLLADNETKNM